MGSVKDNFMGRTGADIFRILTVALREKIGDQNLNDVSIIRVDISKDLGTARVFVNQKSKEMETLTGFFRNEIARNLKIKRVPNLRFIIDEGEKNAARVDELLKQIKGEK